MKKAPSKKPMPPFMGKESKKEEKQEKKMMKHKPAKGKKGY